MQKVKEIGISKEVLSSMISDIEHLIDDIESILDKSGAKTLEKRLRDVKERKIKGLLEKDFDEFMRKEGINAG